MNHKPTPNPLFSQPVMILILGGLFIAGFWLLDIAFDSSRLAGILGHPARVPEPSDARWHRLFYSTQLVAFIAVIWLMARKRVRLESELETAIQLARDEQAKLEAVISSIPDGVSIQDLEFRVMFQNEAHQGLVGGDYRGEPCYHAYSGMPDICPACPLADAMADGGVHRIEKPGKPGGGVDFIEITASPIRNANGEIVGGLEIVRDISARKWTEEAIKAQTLFFQQLIDTIPSPIFYKNTLGIFLGCNQAFAECIGRSRAEVVGRTLYELVPPAMAAEFVAKDDELFANPGTQIYEAFVPCAATATLRTAIFYKATFPDPYGEVAGLVGVVIDITERIVSEKEIRELNQGLSRQAEALAAVNRELEAYNYSFTHDLRNNLTRISTASQLLEEMHGSTLPEDGRMLVQGVIAAVCQIQELSEAMQLLFLVTRQELQLKQVDLAEMATGLIMDLRLADIERQAVFVINPEMVVQADPRLMKVLLKNLLDNAWKYSGKRNEPVIELGVKADADEPRFYIRDNGAGFPEEHAAELFQPFKRLHHSKDFPGTGIGLATVERIIHRHGGRIWAEGAIDRGATFWFTIPAPDSALPEPGEKGQ